MHYTKEDTFLWLLQYCYMQDLDPSVAYKASSGYLLSFVSICIEKRQEVKERISDHVPQIHPRGYFCPVLAHFFIFWVGLHLFKTSILIRFC